MNGISTYAAPPRTRHRRHPSRMGRSRGAYQRGTIGGRAALRAARIALNLSQEQVAAAVLAHYAAQGIVTSPPISASAVSRIEHGTQPREVWLEGYAAALKLTAGELRRLLDQPLVTLPAIVVGRTTTGGA